ncbi:MAG: hypothetical protein HN390_00910 [Anaerolineae bacterium]|nr:hypothetical protein [Anaerolineae bacterium]
MEHNTLLLLTIIIPQRKESNITGDELFFVEPGIHSVRYEAVVEGADGGRIGVGAPLRSTLGEALS